MERSSNMKRLGGNKNNHLGKKRTSKSLENNFLFRQYLCGKVEGEYENTFNIFKHFLAFDWEDEKIVKQKFCPMLNLSANSLLFYFNCLYFPFLFKYVIEKRKEIPQVFEKLIQRFAENSNFHRKYSPIKAKKHLMNDLNDLFRKEIKNNFEKNDAKENFKIKEGLENLDFIYKKEIDDENKGINNIEEYTSPNCNFNFINLNDDTLKESKNRYDYTIYIDNMIDDLTNIIESIKKKNSKIIHKITENFVNSENRNNQLSFKSFNSSPTHSRYNLRQDMELTNQHKESYLHFLNMKHEEFKKTIKIKQPMLRFKDTLDKLHDDSICLCVICNNGNYEDQDLFVYCVRCEINVHQTCYGITELPNEDWLCNACSKLDNSDNLECLLCPVKGGAMKETNLKKSSALYSYIYKLRTSNLKSKQNSSNRNDNKIQTNPIFTCFSKGNIPDKILTPIKSEYNLNKSGNNTSLINSNVTHTTNSSENEENIYERNISNPSHTFKSEIPKFKICKEDAANIDNTENAWIHLSCALWTPEIEISNFQKKEEIKNIDNITKEKFKDKCSICKLINHGPTKNCWDSCCPVKFHVECARINNLSLEIEEKNGILEYQIFCNTHRPHKLLKKIETRKNKIEEDVRNFSQIILKNLNNFEKEYKYSLIKFEKKKVPLPNHFSGKNENLSNVNKVILNTTKAKDSHSVNHLKINLSLREKFRFFSQLKYVCKLYSNFDTITLKKIKGEHTEILNYTFDYNSFKNKIRFSEIKDLKQYPWSLIRVKNYSVDKIKKIFKLLIPDETTYNRKILKRTIKHKDKKVHKYSMRNSNNNNNQQDNCVNVIYENGNENAIIENYEKDENLYCYCHKIYSENCDYEDDCKGAFKGWFHKKCVNELKWKSKKSLIDPNFKFICKECKEFHQDINVANVKSEIIYVKDLNKPKSNLNVNIKEKMKLKKEYDDILIQIKEEEESSDAEFVRIDDDKCKDKL